MGYDWEQYYREKDQPYFVPDEVLVRELTSRTPGRALDLGTGEGGDALWLAERGWEVTAVDQSKTALKTLLSEARRRRLKLNATCSDILKFVPNELFDLVLLAFIHFDKADRGKLWKKCRELVKTSGQIVIISIVNPTGQKATLPTNTFPVLAELLPELQQAGLKIQKSEEIYRRMQWSPEESFEGETVLVVASKSGY